MAEIQTRKYTPVSDAIDCALNPTAEQQQQEDPDWRRKVITDLVDEIESGPTGGHIVPKERLGMFSNNTVLRSLTTINARLRGKDSKEAWEDLRAGKEGHGILPLDYTPAGGAKIDCISKGTEAIKDYIDSSKDDMSTKLDTVAMAWEMLIVRTHLFNDGNGRTSRFVAEFIRNGLDNKESLLKTATSTVNPVYRRILKSRESMLYDAANYDLAISEEDRETLRNQAEEAPSEVEVMERHVKLILDDKEYRDYIEAEVEEYKRRLGEAVVFVLSPNSSDDDSGAV